MSANKKKVKIISMLLVLSILLVTTPIAVSAYGTPTDVLYHNAVYRIRNVATNRCLTVASSSVSKGTNVIHTTYNQSSLTQQFRLNFDDNNDGECFHSMSSAGGGGLVLDIQRKGASVPDDGMNVQMWQREIGNEDNSQQWYLYEGVTPMSIIFCPVANENVALTAIVSSSGTNGTTSSSNGNVCITDYEYGNTYQEWYLELVGTLPSTPNKTISQLRTQFENGKFWNHEGSSSNNSWGCTPTNCQHAHGNCNIGENCTCNTEGSATQCAGYTNAITKEIYLTYYYNIWPVRKLSSSGQAANIKPGDIIRTADHWLVVHEGVSATSTYKCTDCNMGGSRTPSKRCWIRWDATNTQTIDRIFYAPYAWS
ncbi:MAG: RICIN domain-containing protein [Clostridia bacterium]|nr:RICIN domain-containing protein [Clostridia bacterium]